MSNGREAKITGHLELLYPSEYVKAADLKGKDVTVVIDHLTWENLVMAGGKKDRKVTVHLKSARGVALEKRWVVGKTVLRQIAASLGGETDVSKWSGGKITMYPTTCKGGTGATVECIRVRVRVNQSATEVSEEMSAAPAPRRDFGDEASDEPPSERPGPWPPPGLIPTVSEAEAIANRCAAARSEKEINLIAADFETVKGRIKTTEAAQLRTLIAARREALAGVVAPDHEPAAGEA